MIITIVSIEQTIAIKDSKEDIIPPIVIVITDRHTTRHLLLDTPFAPEVGGEVVRSTDNSIESTVTFGWLAMSMNVVEASSLEENTPFFLILIIYIQELHTSDLFLNILSNLIFKYS